MLSREPAERPAVAKVLLKPFVQAEIRRLLMEEEQRVARVNEQRDTLAQVKPTSSF